ncbi:MAG: non-heme iron oxygenase ferredoxin subunit [Candidatus Dormibacteria bacterium]
MGEWIRLADQEDCPPGYAVRFAIGNTLIACFNVGGTYFITDDTCSHAQASLAEGDLDEDRCTIECPLHGSCFDLRSGNPLTLPATEPIATYQVRADENGIYVLLEPAMEQQKWVP